MKVTTGTRNWKNDPTAEKVPLCGRDFVGTTCAIRAMNTHVGANDGLVSNGRDSEIRESSAQGAELDSRVRTFRWSEPHVIKRNKSQRNNRKLNGPSALETAYGSFSTGRDWRGIFCCLAVLKRYLNFVRGPCLVCELAPLAVGMGTEKHVPL